jgi:hypothetical protein
VLKGQPALGEGYTAPIYGLSVLLTILFIL